MSRYIDADALLEHLQSKLKLDYEMGLYNHGALTESFVRFVERQPTADVEEVRHGEWRSYEGYCECLLCHRKYVNTSLYCPNCGAKMDGERSENGT